MEHFFVIPNPWTSNSLVGLRFEVHCRMWQGPYFGNKLMFYLLSDGSWIRYLPHDIRTNDCSDVSCFTWKRSSTASFVTLHSAWPSICPHRTCNYCDNVKLIKIFRGSGCLAHCSCKSSVGNLGLDFTMRLDLMDGQIFCSIGDAKRLCIWSLRRAT